MTADPGTTCRLALSAAAEPAYRECVRAHGRVIEVPERGPADLASVHPVVRAPGGVPSVQVFRDDDRVVLTGSVDTFTAPRLARVLVESPGARASTVLDLSLLDFVDVAGCRVLARWAAGLEAPLRVAGASRLVQRMWPLLGLDELAPVVFEGSRA